MAKSQLLQMNLIELLEIEDFSDEKKYELIEKSVDLVQKRVFLRVLKTLSSDKKDELLKLLEQEGKPMYKKELFETLRAGGVEGGYSTFKGAIDGMKEKGELFENKGEKNKTFCSLSPFEDTPEELAMG
mgnify:CR=1 FL=1